MQPGTRNQHPRCPELSVLDSLSAFKADVNANGPQKPRTKIPGLRGSWFLGPGCTGITQVKCRFTHRRAPGSKNQVVGILVLGAWLHVGKLIADSHAYGPLKPRTKNQLSGPAGCVKVRLFNVEYADLNAQSLEQMVDGHMHMV